MLKVKPLSSAPNSSAFFQQPSSERLRLLFTLKTQRKGRTAIEVKICSRKDMEALLAAGIPEKTAIISFSDPIDSRTPKDYVPMDFTGKYNRVFPVALYDLDMDCLPQVGLTYDTFFPEVSALAEFIYQAKEDGLDMICQCEYGQSRSAACAAAILEHFYKNGISIFADYRYYPNQMVYHKVFNALEARKHGEERK